MHLVLVGLSHHTAPVEVREQIGISRERLRVSYRQALHIRRRFTVLDLADRSGVTRGTQAYMA